MCVGKQRKTPYEMFDVQGRKANMKSIGLKCKEIRSSEKW